MKPNLYPIKVFCSGLWLMCCKTPLGLCSRRAEEQGLLLDAAASSGANILVMARWTMLPGGGKRWERLKKRSLGNYPFLATEIIFPQMILFRLSSPSSTPPCLTSKACP